MGMVSDVNNNKCTVEFSDAMTPVQAITDINNNLCGVSMCDNFKLAARADDVAILDNACENAAIAEWNLNSDVDCDLMGNNRLCFLR